MARKGVRLGHDATPRLTLFTTLVMIKPFLITNNLTGYVDGSIPCLSKTLPVTEGVNVPKENPNYSIWVSNDAHVRMLIISLISEASFRHVQEMHGDETSDAYLNRSQEHADALAEIDEHVKDKDLVMLTVSELAPQLSALGFQVSPITPSGPQPFYSARSNDNNNNRSNNNYNRVNCNNSYDIGTNSHVTPDLAAMDTLEAYYGNDVLHVGNAPIISSVSHLSPTSQTYTESFNGQPSLVSSTSIPTPPPPIPPPLPPITRQRPANTHQHHKQQGPYNPSANHASRQAIKAEYDALMKNGTWTLVLCAFNTNVVDEYDAVMKNGTWSLVLRASNTNVVDGTDIAKITRKPDKNGHENGKSTQEPRIIKKSQPK
nr:hypothetical protein [Tanacetum cinerariifolium]